MTSLYTNFHQGVGNGECLKQHSPRSDERPVAHFARGCGDVKFA
jgi:hypothetical protein